MWFALKIILYLLAAGGILAWCAYSLRKSRDLLGKYLRSLPAEEVRLRFQSSAMDFMADMS